MARDLHLILLGGCRLSLDGGRELALPRRKSAAILAYLARSRDRRASRDTLATLLWGDDVGEDPRHSLRQALLDLRRTIPSGDSVVVQGNDLALSHRFDVDVDRFERAASLGTAPALSRAAGHYRGDFLEGFAVGSSTFEEWLVAERRSLKARAHEVLNHLLEHQMRDRAPTAILTALHLLRLDPMHEAAHRTLMRLLVRHGRRAEALRQYQVCVEVLERELGVPPERETTELYQNILRAAESHPPRHRRSSRPSVQRVLRVDEAHASDLAPMIGRDSDQAFLRGAVADRAATRGSRMVLVTGEAGIGKTRLIEELLQSSQQDAGRVLIGRCYVSEQLLSMGPWVHALRSDARAVRRNLDALHPAYRLELAKLLPELGKSSVPLGAAEVDPLRIFEAVTSLLLCLARRRAVVVVLEDLHWADDLTLRLLAFLLRALRDEPLLVIATARDDEPTWQSNAIVAELMGAPGVRAIRLEPLERATMLALAQTLAGDRVRIDGALEERIWRLSEGNPLVVVETMRMLREADSDVSAADVVMPERMRDLIEQRLQRLDRAGDELVAAAATLGRAVPFPLLQHTTGLSDGAATHALEAVVRQRILHEAGGQVDFVHDRIREVAHDRMLARRRKLLHARAVAAMEDLYAGTLDEHLETVGQHAYEAELWDVAFRYLRRAGLRALARASFRAAGTLLDHARDALSRFPETPENQSAMVDLLFSLRFVGVQAGLRERCAEQLEVAERLARRLGDQRRLGLALAHQSNHVRVHGDHEAAESIGWKALEVAHRCDDIELLVYAPHNLGQMFFSVGQFRRALEFCGQALGVLNEDVARVEAGASPRFGASRGPGATPLLIMRRTTRFWMSKANAALGDFPVAFALATANEEEMNELGAACDALTIVLTTLSLGIPRLACGDVDAAMPILERTLAAARSGGMGAYSIEAASHLGQAYALAGRIDDALAVLERPMEPEFNGNQPPGYPFRLARLAEAYWLAGRTTDASRVAADALHAARKRRERGYEAACLRMLAETATDTSGEACRHFAEAIDVGETLGMAPLVAHCRLGLARVLHRTGDVLHARRQAALAEAHYRRMEMHRWLSEAELLARDGG